MNTRISFAAGAIALACALTPAKAADIYAPSAGGLKDPVGETTIIPDSIGYTETADWYIRADFGVNVMNAPDGSGNSEGTSYVIDGLDFDTLYSFSVGAGRYVTPNVRLGLDVEYRHDSKTNFDNGGIAAAMPELTNLGSIPLELSTTTLMLNAVYDFAPARRLSPYVGGGVGWAFHRLSFDGRTFSNGLGTGTLGNTDGTSNSFAANLMAGVSWKMRQGMFVDMGYRATYLGDAEIDFDYNHPGAANDLRTKLKVEDMMSHEFKIGLRYDLY